MKDETMIARIENLPNFAALDETRVSTSLSYCS